ncbi:MAG: PDZ domain-containing protein [Phycisphaerales bacterium]|nr:PDZ domain-containing protein [Phycisphaerales bacterium]NNM27513.1 PDZ domain-containing protein [Phycisphaerales bacterium]
MNTHSNQFGRATLLTAVTIALASATCLGASSDESPVADHEVILVTPDNENAETYQMFVTKSVSVDDAGENSVQVRVENGDVTVIVNGEVLAADRIEHRDGRIVILDENGDPIEDIRIAIGGGHDLAGGWVMDDNIFAMHPTPPVMLGVHLGEPGPALESHLRLDTGKTTMLTGVLKGLPAHAAGLAPYDVITRINGTSPADSETLLQTLSTMDAGETVTLTVIHEGTRRDVNVTLAAYDRDAMSKAEVIGQRALPSPFLGQRSMVTPKELPNLWHMEDGKILEKLPQLREFFLDDDNRMFELAPGTTKWREERDDVDAHEHAAELEDRIHELEELLNKLIERAKRDER